MPTITTQKDTIYNVFEYGELSTKLTSCGHRLISGNVQTKHGIVRVYSFLHYNKDKIRYHSHLRIIYDGKDISRLFIHNLEWTELGLTRKANEFAKDVANNNLKT